MRTWRRVAQGAIATSAALAACGLRAGHERPIVFPFATDTVRAEVVAPGVIHRFIYARSGPWGIHVLDVDLSSCNAAVAVKGGPVAAGRTRTSKLLADLGATRNVVGGVNADFFSLANGTPIGALIAGGRVVVGPYTQPVLAFDSAGRARVTVLRGAVAAHSNRQAIDFVAWNRPGGSGPAFYDASWGTTTDTSTGTLEVVLDGSPLRVTEIDSTPAGVSIPLNVGVLVMGRAADSLTRAAFHRFQVGDSVQVSRDLSPWHPREAVGGRPMLVRDSVVVGEVDTEGQASFIARNPRTAAGVGRNGTRLILAVIDGRQKGYSDGMTLRETAELMRALGARDAINLDGGGSSTMVVRSAAGVRVVNRTSDSLPNGVHVERAVGDALAIVGSCR